MVRLCVVSLFEGALFMIAKNVSFMDVIEFCSTVIPAILSTLNIIAS